MQASLVKNVGIHRIKSWKEYRKLAQKLKPNTIFYSLDPHPLRNPPYGLKLIFYHELDSYIFQDYAANATLYKTKIPIQGLDKSEVPILPEDIENFIHTQIGKTQVSPIHSFWSL
jgi:hypothetical protein